MLVLSGMAVGGIAVYSRLAKKSDAACPVIIPTYTTESGQVAIDETYSGQTVDIKAGNQLILTVKYFPSTGYGWALKEISNPEVLKKVNSIYAPDGV